MEESEYICPITNAKCNDKCKWSYTVTVMDDDGMDSQLMCSLNEMTYLLSKIAREGITVKIVKGEE